MHQLNESSFVVFFFPPEITALFILHYSRFQS